MTHDSPHRSNLYLISSPGQPLSRQAHLYKEHRRISRGSVSSDSSTNGTQFTTRAPEIMPRKKKSTKQAAPKAAKAAAQPPPDDDESPRTQRQKRRQMNQANLPSKRKKQQQQQQDGDDSGTDYTTDGEELATLPRSELEELLKTQAMMKNFLNAQKRKEEARVKSGRAKAMVQQQETMGSYDPKTMTSEQKEVQKHFKHFGWRTVKFVNDNTKKNAAKLVFLALRRDYQTDPLTLDENGKH